MPACDHTGPDNLLGLMRVERGTGTANTSAPGPQRITILSEQDSA